MIRFYEKGIDVIKKSFAGADKGVICTPYYTERGLQLLDPFFDAAEEVEFWTRLNPLDWRDGVADMEAFKTPGSICCWATEKIRTLRFE